MTLGRHSGFRHVPGETGTTLQIMKMTLTLISFLRPVFFTDRTIVSGMADGSLKKSALFSASQIPC